MNLNELRAVCHPLLDPELLDDVRRKLQDIYEKYIKQPEQKETTVEIDYRQHLEDNVWSLYKVGIEIEVSRVISSLKDVEKTFNATRVLANKWCNGKRFMHLSRETNDSTYKQHLVMYLNLNDKQIKASYRCKDMKETECIELLPNQALILHENTDVVWYNENPNPTGLLIQTFLEYKLPKVTQSRKVFKVADLTSV